MLLLKNVALNLLLKGNWRKRQSMAQRWAGVRPGGWQQVLGRRAAPSPWKGCSVQLHAYRCCKEPENNGINPKSSNSMWLLLDYVDSLGKRKKKKAQMFGDFFSWAGLMHFHFWIPKGTVSMLWKIPTGIAGASWNPVMHTWLTDPCSQGRSNANHCWLISQVNYAQKTTYFCLL